MQFVASNSHTTETNNTQCGGDASYQYQCYCFLRLRSGGTATSSKVAHCITGLMLSYCCIEGCCCLLLCDE